MMVTVVCESQVVLQRYFVVSVAVGPIVLLAHVFVLLLLLLCDELRLW